MAGFAAIANTARRALRDKGVVFVLQACRALFGFAAKQRHLPAYAPNPFSMLAFTGLRVGELTHLLIDLDLCLDQRCPAA